MLQNLGVPPHTSPLDLYQAKGEPCPMARAVLEVVRGSQMRFEDVGNLTLGQLRLIRRGLRPAGTRDEIFEWPAEVVAAYLDRPEPHPLIGGVAGGDGASFTV